MMDGNQQIRFECLVMIVGATLLFGSVGCSGGDGDSDPPSVEEAQQQTFELLAKSYCARAFRCPEAMNPTTLMGVSRFVDESTCVEEFERLFQTGEPEPINEALTRYDADLAQQCIDEIRSGIEANPCESTLTGGNTPEACERAFQGKQSKGEACDTGDHCQSGECDTEANPDECYGKCVDPPEKVGEGETCGADNRECDDSKDLVCAFGNGEQTCIKRNSRQQGESCNGYQMCADGLSCAGGTCQELTFNAEGSTCNPLEGPYCQPGLVCVQVGQSGGSNMGKCMPPRGTDGECLTQGACKYGHYCKGATRDSPGKCAPLKALGESCKRSRQCESQICTDGSCVEPEEPGNSGEMCEVPTG